MDGSRDEAMVDGHDDDAESRLPLSSDEQRVLDLYDALQQLQLEIAVINAQASHQSGTVANVQLPDLLPYVERRDEAAMAVARQASDMGALRSDLTEVRAETTRVSRNNVELTTVLFDLAENVKQTQAGRLDNPRTGSEVARLEGEVKVSRQRWRVMKGVASGVVSGSGVDWARDDELRDIVLDPESEE
ncbi:Uncharacterized protein TCAP_06692 [Tolypocladium capitatum]|uniref:Centromere protein H C-terminal domain-containing protein n=1 Tax=Tolypocladium capitatum TaxID=45235 RepID=A0A2K3Q721_9HYPO|nr:Uncharacterized protein TCAP_06692 [Tolypocladium capitatum]